MLKLTVRNGSGVRVGDDISIRFEPKEPNTAQPRQVTAIIDAPASVEIVRLEAKKQGR